MNRFGRLLILGGIAVLVFIAQPLSASAIAGGYQGIVEDRNTGERISNVRIIFESVDNNRQYEAFTDVDGRYQIELPEGGYRVTVAHRGYYAFSSLFIVPGTSFYTGNIYLVQDWVPPEMRYDRPHISRIRPGEDRPPTVDISVSPSTVQPGQDFTVTVTGSDDEGLDTVWWFGDFTGDDELQKAHMQDCGGDLFCERSWVVSTSVTGTLALCANSRDTAYPTEGEPHQASEGAGIPCVGIEVQSSAASISGNYYMDNLEYRLIVVRSFSATEYSIEEPTSPWPWVGTATLTGNELNGVADFRNSDARMLIEGVVRPDHSIEIAYHFIGSDRVDYHVWYPAE